MKLLYNYFIENNKIKMRNIMFALVALMALYLGGRNIKNAFVLAPFGQWEFINWSLFIVGILMVLAGIACIWQAGKDYNAKEAELAEKERIEKEKRQRQFYYDETEE
jgi:uncharacterized membrane protein YqjE